MPRSEQGVTHDRYMVVPRTLVFLTRGNAILLLKGAPNKRLWANRYNGVGGHIEKGEDVLSAARRELAEETGLEADLWLCGTIMVDAGDGVGIAIFVLSGECATGEPIDSKEGVLEWVPVQNLTQMPLVEDLYQLIPRVLATRPGDAPFFGRYNYDSNDRLQVHFSA